MSHGQEITYRSMSFADADDEDRDKYIEMGRELMASMEPWAVIPGVNKMMWFALWTDEITRRELEGWDSRDFTLEDMQNQIASTKDKS